MTDILCTCGRLACVANLCEDCHAERAPIAAPDYTQNARRTNTPLRRVRIAIRTGETPSVKAARDAIRFCAYLVETYGATEAGAAMEAQRLAPLAVSRAGGAR